jgi:hypothetical protein
MEIFYPVFLLIFHTLFIAAFMGFKRYTAVKGGAVDPTYYQLYRGEEPDKLRALSRHVVNLLEVPLLFYVGSVIAFVTGQSGVFLLGLAWAYVGLRLAHSFVHLGSNTVIWRFKVFVTSMAVLTVFLAVILVRLVANQ